MRKTEPLDNALNLKLANIEMDGNGITWNDFVNKRKKKRGFFLFKTFGLSALVLAILLIGLIPVFKTPTIQHVEQNQSKAQKSSNQINSHINSENSIDKHNNKLIVNNLQKTRKTDRHLNDRNYSNWGSTISPNNHPFKTNEPNYNNQWIESESTEELVENHLKMLKINKFPFYYELPTDDTYFDPIENKVKQVENDEIKTFVEFGISGLSSTQSLKISDIGNAFIHRDYAGIRNAAESNRYGFGLNFNYGKIKNNMEFSIGLNYNRLNSNNRYNFIYKDRPIIDIDGRIVGYNSGNEKTINFTSQHSSSFIEIPLQMDIYIKNKNPFNLNKKGLHLGLYPQFLQSNLGQLPNAQFLDLKDNLSTENYKTAMMGFEIGMTFKHRINKNTAIKLMPYYRLNSGLRQVQSHYTTRMNYLGLKCLFQIGL